MGERHLPNPGSAPRPTNPAIGAGPGPDPLVVAVGLHIATCSVCRIVDGIRHRCPTGRELADVAGLAVPREREQQGREQS